MFAMAYSTEGDRHWSGQTWESPLDHDRDVVMYDLESSVITEVIRNEGSSESSEECCKETTKGSAKVNILPPVNAATELENRLEEMRRKNKALLERFNEVEEDKRRAEWRGSALRPENTKLVTASYSANTANRSDRWEKLSVTVMNQDNSRSVAKQFGGGRSLPKSRRIEDRLEKSEGEEDNFAKAGRQLIVCTIDNREDAGGCWSDLSDSTSDAERREYLRWKKRHNRSSVELLDEYEEDLSVRLRRSREQRRKDPVVGQSQKCCSL
ncbi:coiled-coil domain-containing protein 9-like [Esox lucius]|uniref:coiled-coil domain-containing protein 9-like n=1 Tax=Esox lucius TaxID=8010 RepID=UPI0005760080|nr:coiled-coil domain-containing protein 9-like [Esox lucius]